MVSPNLEADADDLETASEMSARRLSWAKKATGNLRISPERHILQTSLWAPQRKELQVKELKVLSLLGFNVVGNRRDDLKGFPELRRPGHTHNISHGLGMTRTAIDANMAKVLARTNHKLESGVPFWFKDENMLSAKNGPRRSGSSAFCGVAIISQGVLPRLNLALSD